MWYLSQEKQKVNVTKELFRLATILTTPRKKSFFDLKKIIRKKNIRRKKKHNKSPCWLQFFEYKEKKRIQILLLKTLLAKEVGQV